MNKLGSMQQPPGPVWQMSKTVSEKILKFHKPHQHKILKNIFLLHKGQIPRPLFSAQSSKFASGISSGHVHWNFDFCNQKIALRQWVELFLTHWRNKKAKPIKFKHFYKKPLTSLFLHFSKSKQDGDTEHTFCRGMYSSGNIAPSKICTRKICS